MEERLFSVVDENGNEILCEVLHAFRSEEFNKSYVFYVPVETKDEDEEVEVLCYAYEPAEDGSIGELLPIESDEEWEMLQRVFDETFGDYITEDFDDEDYDDFEDDEDEDFDDDDDDDCCCGHHHHDDDDECCCHDDDEE